MGTLTLGTTDPKPLFKRFNKYLDGAGTSANKILYGVLGKEGIADKVADAQRTIASIGEIFSMASAPTEVTSAFEAGQLVVQHRFPEGINASIDVSVTIDSATLAKAIADVKFKHQNKQLKSVAFTE